jgi:hypothetical protein
MQIDGRRKLDGFEHIALTRIDSAQVTHHALPASVQLYVNNGAPFTGGSK